MFDCRKSKKSPIDYTSSRFLECLKTRWDELHDNSDVFRYKINNMPERLVDDKYILQLNPSRLIFRRRRDECTNIMQLRGDNEFGFMVVPGREILFAFKDKVNEEDDNLIIVNISPISRYHSLLVPAIHRNYSQVIDKRSLKLAIDLILSAQDRDLRIAFNSLCAMASVNNLHFHLLFVKNKLPVETVKCKQIKGPLYRFDFLSYPIAALCFEVTKDSHKVEEIYKLLEYLVENNIAHNLFMTRGESFEGNDDAVRVMIWPRKSCVDREQLGVFCVAALELSGFILVYNQKTFDQLTAEVLEYELKKWRLPNFHHLCEKLEKLY